MMKGKAGELYIVERTEKEIEKDTAGDECPSKVAPCETSPRSFSYPKEITPCPCLVRMKPPATGGMVQKCVAEM